MTFPKKAFVFNRYLVLGMFVLVKLLLGYLLVNPSYELHRDEFLHLDQGKHLAWGYVSVPPFTSWVSWIILQLGNTVFWVKFFPSLFGALTLILVWKTIESLNGKRFALVLGATAVTFSVILRINLLYQPNSFDILSWTCCYYILVRHIQTGNNKWLLIGAATLALGFLNKYNIVFLVMGLLPAIVLTRHRVIFLNRFFYVAMALALLMLSPNLTWQYQQGFPVFHHLKILAETQLVNVDRTGFLKEQLLYFIGSLFVIIAALVAFVRYPPFFKYRLFGMSLVFTLCILLFLKAKGYYAIGLYPIYLAFGAVYIEYLISTGWLRYLRPVAVITIVLLFIPLIKIAFPVNSAAVIQKDASALQRLGLLRWEDGKDHPLPQDFADMLGWKELAHKTDSIVLLLNDQEATLLLCDNYGQAGAINYYSEIQGISAFSMNADYLDWFELDTKEIRHVILVKDIYDGDKQRTRERKFFNEVTLIDSITNPFARERGTNLYLLKDATTSINSILRVEILKRKKEASNY